MKKLLFVFLLFPFSLLSQEDSIEMLQYSSGFAFKEGIYANFEDFKKNQPSYTQAIERRGSDLYWYNDSLNKMVKVPPSKIWGYSQAHNVYISYTGAYWRFINMGQLTHFSAIFISRYNTVDAYGFPVERVSKKMEHLFMDFNTGKVELLSYKNLEPYFEKDALLYKNFKKLKRKKQADLILALKTYNELYPIYFPQND